MPSAPRATPGGALFNQPAAGPCPFENSGLSFTLSEVIFEGATALSSGELSRSYAGLVGREAPLAEICRIRDRAADIYFDSGVLARVEIPEQRIADGHLRLQVVEAWISEVTVRGEAGPAQRQVAAILEGLEGQRPFDIDIVQRRLLLAADVPGMGVKATVRPAENGQAGAVAMDVVVERRSRVEAIAAVQNMGSETVGPWTGLVRLDVNSLTPLAERTSLVVSATSDGEEQRVVQLLEQIPLGDNGAMLRGSLAVGRSAPGGELEPLGLEGESFVGALNASYPLVRHRRRGLSVTGGFEWADQKTEFGSNTLYDDQLRVASLRLDGEARSRPAAQGWALAGGVELRKGLGVFGASEAGEETLSRTDADPEAFVARMNFGGDARITRRVSLGLKGLAQWSDDPLLAYEEMSIGNYTIGRGYDPSTLSGDLGVAAAIEARVAVADRASVFGFLDTAWIDNHDAFSEAQSVASIGAGLRWRLLDRVDLELTYAKPRDDMPGADERILVNLVTRLF